MEASPSPMQRFYANKVIFLTGGTSTIGKLLIAKLLHCCPQLDKIVLLIRAKNAHQIGQRLQELLDHPAFDMVRYHTPELLSKVRFIRGELSLPNLGISAEDVRKLADETDIVFHLGGTSLFDRNFKTAAEINVRATRDLLEVAKQMTRLKALVHLSSLFVNCHNEVLDEQVGRAFISPQALIAFLESMDPNYRMQKPINLGRCPNNFLFTKAIAEELIKESRRHLPAVILRVPLLLPSRRYPSRGFTDNADGLTGIIMTAYLGLNKSVLADTAKTAEVLPADMVANALIAIAWETAQSKTLNDNVEVPKDEHFLVYNLTSSKCNRLSWKHFFLLSDKYAHRYPTLFALSHPWYILHAKKSWHLILVTILHYIPGYFTDFINLYVFYETRYIGYYAKIDTLSRTLTYFTTHAWDTRVDNMRHLLRKMDDDDKEMFDFDASGIDWEDYFEYYVRGIRKYVLKDAERTLPEARQQQLHRLYLLIVKLITIVSIVLYVFGQLFL